jgi:hypothetical protein
VTCCILMYLLSIIFQFASFILSLHFLYRLMLVLTL